MKWLQKRTAILVSVLAATLLSGCGPDHAGGDDDDTTTGDGGIAAGSLRITPADHAITVNVSAVTVPYKAFRVKPAASETYVTNSRSMLLAINKFVRKVGHRNVKLVITEIASAAGRRGLA